MCDSCKSCGTGAASTTHSSSAASSSCSVASVDARSTAVTDAGASCAPRKLLLTGDDLTLEDLMDIANGPDVVQVELADVARERVRKSRAVVDHIVDSGRVVYGITTGFGNFADVVISRERLSELQLNLIHSHCCGVGKPLPIRRARVLMALRINVLCKGCSGISLANVEKLVRALNANCVSRVPYKGSVGASGDLAPLAHLALGMLGEGDMWNPTTQKWEPAAGVLRAHSLDCITLGPKEGLALINGTQLITCIGSEVQIRAERAALQADVIAALSLEGLKGTTRAFDPRIHAVRPHAGQAAVASRVRRLLLGMYRDSDDPLPSEITLSHRNCGSVQDAYSLRCTPQVHGVTHDTLRFTRGILQTEINSATDNPLVLEEGLDETGQPTGDIISGGNFHGEYPAKALDYVAIAVHELANISERRIERLVDHSKSNLPAFLVKEGGINSGYMMAHVTAAALTSENKVLVHPASSDTIPTSAGKEDHVSMGPWAARKALQVVKNVETVLAIELLCACQAIDFLRPLRTSPALEAVYAVVRSEVPPYERDRAHSPDIEKVSAMVRDGRIWGAVRDFLAL